MEKDKIEFSMMSDAHEKIVFKPLDILKTFSQLRTEQKPELLF